MRRLIDWKRRERGAVAVVVAITMVLLMGFAGLAVDMGGAFSEKQQLQNGADAAVLAIAQDCALGRPACASYTSTATDYTKQNKLDGVVDSVTVTKVPGSLTTPASVTVVPSYRRQNWFGGAIGVPMTTVTASATANWGYPSGGDTLPLTFSLGCFLSATGGWDGAGQPIGDTTVILNLNKEKTCISAHSQVPGGFGWLDGTQCLSHVVAGTWVSSDPGNDGSQSCKDFDWTTVQNQIKIIPIFDVSTGSGSGAQYKIKGLAAVRITGYCFGPSAEWNLSDCPSKKRMQAKFVSYTDTSGKYVIDPNAPHFGAESVLLTA